MKSTAVYGILGFVLIFISALSPGYIVDYWNDQETEGLTPSESVTSTNSTSYRPYADFNTTDRRIRDFTGDDSYEGSVKMNNGLATINNIPTVTYDYSGFENMVVCDTFLADMQVVFIFYGNAGDLNTDGITKLNFMLDLDETYYIHHIRFWQTDSTYTLAGTSVDIAFSSAWGSGGSFFTGRNWFNSTVTQTELNSGITQQSGYTDDHCIIHYYVKCNTDYTASTPFYFSMQWEPDFYEETTYNNQTVYTPASVTSEGDLANYTLAIGGAVMVGIALISTPWINPTEMVKSKGRKRKKRG